jgi:hypothetical protein
MASCPLAATLRASSWAGRAEGVSPLIRQGELLRTSLFVAYDTSDTLHGVLAGSEELALADGGRPA